jgi:hypothetical protein
MSDIPPKNSAMAAGSVISRLSDGSVGTRRSHSIAAGLCAVIVGIRTIGVDTTHDVCNTIGFVKVGLVLGLFGVLLIWFAIRRRGR